MTQHILKVFSAAERRLVTITHNTMPPRDPDEDEEDEDEGEDRDDEPPVVREPDED